MSKLKKIAIAIIIAVITILGIYTISVPTIIIVYKKIALVS